MDLSTLSITELADMILSGFVDLPLVEEPTSAGNSAYWWYLHKRRKRRRPEGGELGDE